MRERLQKLPQMVYVILIQGDNEIAKKVKMLLFFILIFGLTTNALAATVDDFKSYTSDTDLQNIWEWTNKSQRLYRPVIELL